MKPATLLALSCSLSLTLVACGGSDSQDAACDQAYWDGTVGTCLPAGWKVVDRGTLDERGIPADSTLAAFQADTPFSGQFPTVTVTRETLSDEVDSAAYSEASIQSVQGLPGYALVDKQTVAIEEVDVELHIFTAQPQAENPKSRFYQVSFASGKTGYSFTGAVPVTVEDDVEGQILTILRNATLTSPEEAATDE